MGCSYWRAAASAIFLVHRPTLGQQVDATADLMPVIDEISWRILRGERP